MKNKKLIFQATLGMIVLISIFFTLFYLAGKPLITKVNVDKIPKTEVFNHSSHLFEFINSEGFQFDKDYLAIKTKNGEYITELMIYPIDEDSGLGGLDVEGLNAWVITQYIHDGTAPCGYESLTLDREFSEKYKGLAKYTYDYVCPAIDSEGYFTGETNIVHFTGYTFFLKYSDVNYGINFRLTNNFEYETELVDILTSLECKDCGVREVNDEELITLDELMDEGEDQEVVEATQKQLVVSGKVSATLPEGWTLEAFEGYLYGDGTDPNIPYGIKTIVINAGNSKSITLHGIDVFGISQITPVFYNDTANTLGNYLSHDDAETTALNLNLGYEFEVDRCFAMDDRAYCDFSKDPYASYGTIRISIVEDKYIKTTLNQESGTYSLDDGVPWHFGDLWYWSEISDSWNVQELTQLLQVLDSIQVETN